MGPTQTITSRISEGCEILQLPRLTLSLTGPAGDCRKARLGLEPIVVGTGAECGLVAADPAVSRLHLELRLEAAGIRLRDLGSKNGTFVKGLEVSELKLPVGEPVTLGSSRLTVEEGEGRDELHLSVARQFGGAFGAAPSMRALFALLERAALGEAPILLWGESGTGKGLLAQAIHDASPRQAGPFVVFDCSAVPPTLIEGELFGYTKGAFTGATCDRMGILEQAHGGTLFLDELGELPLEQQTRLLRAIESKQVRPLGANAWRPADARVLTATHRDLAARVEAGTFREDLYFRLAVVVVKVPSLRDRKGDIPMLAEQFLARQNPPLTLADLPPNSLDWLQAHSWPGNVRELWNTLTRLVLLPELGPGVIERRRQPALPMGLDANHLQMPLREARQAVIEQFERAFLLAKYREHRGNVAAIARALGVSKQFTYLMLDRYGFRSNDGRE